MSGDGSCERVRCWSFVFTKRNITNTLSWKNVGINFKIAYTNKTTSLIFDLSDILI